jgi:ABC-type branched-chain amino acid transport systems, ATPase component
MSNQHVLELINLGLKIGGARIIDDVNLRVTKGEFLGVIGPNGAGKTTLFNLISGVMTPTEGDIQLNGDSLSSLGIEQRARAGLGRTFQTSSLFPGLTVFENVRLAAQVKVGGEISVFKFPTRTDEAAQITFEKLELVGLTDRADTVAGVMSHGDKRKLEIAMLLASDPDVILFDEPMAGVASGDVRGLVEVIGEVHKLGKTVLMVEHHIDVVLDLADRVAVMHNGQLLAADSPDKIMANPTVQSAYLGESA